MLFTLPSDDKVRKEYKRLIRNANLKEDASITRVCGAHFPRGEKMCRTQLPSVFPWTPKPVQRRVIEKHDLPLKLKAKKRLTMKGSKNNTNDELEACERPHEANSLDIKNSEDFFHTGSEALSSENKYLSEGKSEDNKKEIKCLTQEINSLRSQLLKMRLAMELDNNKPRFAIEDHKDSDSDISFYTGFPNYDILLFALIC